MPSLGSKKPWSLERDHGHKTNQSKIIMTPLEKRIALFIKDHWEEKEDCLDIEFYRVYTDSRLFNGSVQDCTFSGCQPTDVLSLEYVKNNGNGREYVQLFISTPDDDGQEWFTFSDLSRRDRLNIVRLFEEMIAHSVFEQRTPAIAL